MHTITIDPEHYTSKDIDLISDIIGDIIAEHHGGIADTISFSIEVTFTLEDDADEED